MKANRLNEGQLEVVAVALCERGFQGIRNMHDQDWGSELEIEQWLDHDLLSTVLNAPALNRASSEFLGSTYRVRNISRAPNSTQISGVFSPTYPVSGYNGGSVKGPNIGMPFSLSFHLIVQSGLEGQPRFTNSNGSALAITDELVSPNTLLFWVNDSVTISDIPEGYRCLSIDVAPQLSVDRYRLVDRVSLDVLQELTKCELERLGLFDNFPMYFAASLPKNS